MNPWLLLGWTLLAVLALAYTGAVWEAWSSTRDPASTRVQRGLDLAVALLTPPLVVGALLIRLVDRHR